MPFTPYWGNSRTSLIALKHGGIEFSVEGQPKS